MGSHRAQRGPRRSASTNRSISVTTPVAAGKRRAATPKRSLRGPFLGPLLPSVPLVAGIAALAISAGGAVSAAEPGVVDQVSGVAAASAATSVPTVRERALADREQVVSRDSRRDADATVAEEELVAQAEEQAEDLFDSRDQLEQQSEKQSEKIRANRWVMPLASYRVSAGFGAASYLWSSIHTGLDMAAPLKRALARRMMFG